MTTIDTLRKQMTPTYRRKYGIWVSIGGGGKGDWYRRKDGSVWTCNTTELAEMMLAKAFGKGNASAVPSSLAFVDQVSYELW